MTLINQDTIQFIQVLDDDYLLSLANKGIFKRAKKDFNQADAITLTSEEPLVVDLGDHQVTFNGSDAGSISCTCPDSRFCKHRMMAIWFIQSQLDTVKSSLPPERGELERGSPFEPLLQLDETHLRKRFGKAAYERGIRYYLKCEVTDEVINTRLIFNVRPRHQEQCEQVSFLPIDPLKNVTCSCKKENCTHQISGLIHYLLKHQKISRSDLEELVVKTLPTIDPDLLEEVEQLIYDLINTGLSKLTPLVLTRLKDLGFKAHYESSALEKSLINLQETLARFLNKKGEFSMGRYAAQLVRPLRLIRIYRNNPNDPKIVTELTQLKSEYIELASIELFHVAKEYKAFPNGNHMVSLYFISNQREVYQRSIFTTAYDGARQNPKRQLLNSAIWGEVEDQRGTYPLESFTRSKIILKNSKVNDKNRLSSRGDVIFKGHHDFHELTIDDDFKALKERFIALRRENALLSVTQKQLYAIIEPKRNEPIEFHLERQELTLQVYDQHENSLTLRFFYKKELKNLFEQLQKIYAPDVEDPITPDLFFGRIGFDHDTLYFYPISCYYKGLNLLKNIELDGLYSPTKRKK